MIDQIFKQHVHFEGVATPEKFHAIFTSLYNIPLFKDGLDLILTRMQDDHLKFDVKIIKDWDTNVGCYLTEQNKVFNKVLNRFSNKFRHKIIIKNLLVNVVAHEMAHALEVEGEIPLTQDFRTAIGYDMKDRKPKNLALHGEIQRVMVQDIKPYPQHQVLSELFARYFEVLSLSRDVKSNGAFLTSEVIEFFTNTTKWIDQVFNPKIKDKVDQEISKLTSILISDGKFKNEEKFAHKTDSFFKKTDKKGRKTFAANVKSNAAWHESWKANEQAIEERKNKNIEE